MSLNLSNTPKVYSYSRVSTLEQKKGSGVDIQVDSDVLKRIAEDYNIPIAEETYQDLGKSAYKGEHLKHELGVFLEAVKSGVVATGSILVVYSLDRLSRLEIGHAKQTYYDLTNNGVSVYSIVDNYLYRAHQAADDILSTIIFERSHNESKSKAARVVDAAKQGLKRWRETGQPQSSLGRVPFWIDQTTNTFNVNAEGVRKAIELYLQGVGCLKIKQHLDKHYPYEAVRKSGRTEDSTKRWDYNAINQTFTKPSLIGEKHIKVDGVSHKLEGYYPALIDVDTFQQLKQVKKLKSGRAPEKGAIHLLKGLAKCAECGGAMVFVDKGRGNSAINYVCTNAAKGNHPRQNYSVQVLELITLALCQDKYLQAMNNDSREDIALVEKEIEELELELEELTKRYKENKSLRFLDLIEEAESKVNSRKQDLETIQTQRLNDSFAILEKDVYSDEVRDDFYSEQRGEIRKHLTAVVDHIVVGRSEETSKFTKSGLVQCLTVKVIFKNGKHRIWIALPFKYVNDNGLFPQVMIKSANEDNDLVGRQNYHQKVLTKLHNANLLTKLYPSKGRYTWGEKKLVVGWVLNMTQNEGEHLVKALKQGQTIPKYKEEEDNRFWVNILSQ
ncbi:recombinase family protein [Vibrio sp. M260118]|uniref:recombinase family protein n=1 Tax=Vibrio sp. M260118 TaxID=3020896 RepID=UPI002F3F7016